MVKEFTRPAGRRRRHLRAARGLSRRGLEGDLRPVPPGARPATTRRARRRARSCRSPTGSTRWPGSSRSASSPTGSRDPYGLRRAALRRGRDRRSRGSWRLDWRPRAARGAVALSGARPATVRREDALAELERFFAERLRNLLERRGHAYDEISAVLRVGRLELRRRGRPGARSVRGAPADGLPLAHPRVQAHPQHRRGRAAGGSVARRSTARTPSGSSRRTSSQARPGHRAAGRRVAATGEAMEMIASIAPVARPVLRRRARELPGGGPAAQPPRPAGVDSARVLAAGRLFRRSSSRSEIEMKRVSRSATASRRAPASARRRSAARARAWPR